MSTGGQQINCELGMLSFGVKTLGINGLIDWLIFWRLDSLTRVLWVGNITKHFFISYANCWYSVFMSGI